MGLLGANSTSTAFAFAREVLAPKLGENRVGGGSTEPGLARFFTTFGWWVPRSWSCFILWASLLLSCFAYVLGQFLHMQNHYI
jgi:hypothetical protein